MNEIKLNTLFNIIVDPVDNVYNLDSERSINNIKAILKTFKTVQEQKEDCKMVSARGLLAFRMLVSNN